MNYRWIVIDKSLKNPEILSEFKVLANSNFNETAKMYKIQIPENKLQVILDLIEDELISPFYSHFYSEDPQNDSLVVVFPEKVIKTSKQHPELAIEYGIEHGIPKDQMDIQPKDISGETW